MHLAKNVQQALDPSRALMEHMKAQTEWVRQTQAQTQWMRHLQESLQSSIKPLLEHQRALTASYEPLLRQQDVLRRLFAPSAGLDVAWAKAISSVAATTWPFRQSLEPVLANWFNEYKNLQALRELPAIEMDSSGALAVDGKRVEVSKALRKASAIAETTTSIADPEGVRLFLERLLVYVRSLAKPLRFVVLFLLLPYVVNIVANLTTPTVTEHVKRLLSSSSAPHGRHLARSRSRCRSTSNRSCSKTSAS